MVGRRVAGKGITVPNLNEGVDSAVVLVISIMPTL